MLFLLPPSEWKKQWGVLEESTIQLDLPVSIAVGATPKDLKCSGKRYEEGIELNKHINHWPFMRAIERYTGVMFKAIEHETLSKKAQQYFDAHVRIFSWLYWWVGPTDSIANYKLPADTKWLRTFRWDYFTRYLQSEDVIVDLLPWAHKKYIDFTSLKSTTIVYRVDFFYEEKKMTHWVKWAKWHWLRLVCELWDNSMESRPTSFIYKEKHITVFISLL